jgi:hypothetical protein
MKERPILFSAPMVRALLDGSKTQTRRVLKQATGPSLSVGIEDEPGVAELSWLSGDGPGHDVHETVKKVSCPYGVPGDRLYVREAWRSTGDGGRCDDMPPRDLQPHAVWFEADGMAPAAECAGKARRAFHMPKWASRVTLEITSVRVERLQDISEADAIAEGCAGGHGAISDYGYHATPCEHYHWLWDSINGGSWAANPWVWIVAFRRIRP